jgi:hypothetical protein
VLNSTEDAHLESMSTFEVEEHLRALNGRAEASSLNAGLWLSQQFGKPSSPKEPWCNHPRQGFVLSGTFGRSVEFYRRAPHTPALFPDKAFGGAHSNQRKEKPRTRRRGFFFSV